MKHPHIRLAVVCCAALITGPIHSAVSQNRRPSLGGAQPEGRNCPLVEDQIVIVSPERPTSIKLRVFDLGDGEVSIFQFPLRGILEQTGPTPLDFVFVPGDDFNGTTTFTYRVIPSFDCPRDVQLGRVTLAGGTASDTAVGLAPPAGFDLCGVGMFGPMTFGGGLIGFEYFRRRTSGRMPRRK